MKGKIAVIIQNNRVRYTFTLRRNITILRGNSATGKTTLIEMVRAHEADSDVGISVRCDKNCRVLYGDSWKEQLRHIRDSIVFIDEGNQFLRTKEFADVIRKTDNYYVIAARYPLYNLPYSVDEVYGIVNKTKGYGQIKRIYSEFKNIYYPEKQFEDFDLVITEDSNSGYAFFKSIFEKLGCRCISAKGKSNIAKEIIKTPLDAKILVIADGAAFGPEMEEVLKTGYLRRLEIYLPESFEWLVLKSGIVDGKEVQMILNDPSDYIESKTYFSWERFFTTLLIDNTQDTYLAYNKRKLNPVYLQEKEKKEIIKNMPFQDIKEKNHVR